MPLLPLKKVIKVVAAGVDRTHEAEEEKELSHNCPPWALVVETTMTIDDRDYNVTVVVNFHPPCIFHR